MELQTGVAASLGFAPGGAGGGPAGLGGFAVTPGMIRSV